MAKWAKLCKGKAINEVKPVFLFLFFKELQIQFCFPVLVINRQCMQYVLLVKYIYVQTQLIYI